MTRSNAELEQFAYSASHDLQEPLAVVARFAELIQSRYGDTLEGKAGSWLGFIVGETRRMQEMIDSLLQLSRVSTQPPRFEVVDLSSLVDEAIMQLEEEIEACGAEVRRDELPTLKGDRALLGSLFANLIANAIKFRGHDAPRIHISASFDDDGVCACSVSDNGIGIDPRFAERAFEPFKRLNRLEDYPGSGIGLALCKSVVELHEGRIWVESVEGQGARFHFTLPRDSEGRR
ncbi:MAG: hypothetical protein CME06_13270 [Gemmatimonadetes bacterium]|nr:hypothetical protein [Gemmatimonadota bacterium]